MIKKLYARFPFLTPHYKIERFGVSVTALLILMCVVCGSIMVKHNTEISHMVGNQVQYTENGTTSKTGHAFTVDGVYNSTDGTQCFLLLHFDDMSSMSRSASDYQMFLTGSSYNLGKTDLLSNPQGSIYVFGSSGYMGLYLTDQAGFQSQILKLTLRCKEELADGKEVDVSKYSDVSYTTYDQADIYFNPGGSDKNVIAFLDDGNMDVITMYYQMVIAGKEQTLRDTMNAQLETMQTKLALITEYENRLDDDEIVWTSNVSPEIKNDKVTYDEEKELYYLDTAYTCPQGLNFDWQDKTVQDGYLKSLTSSTYTSFYKQKQAEVSSTPSYSRLTWYMNDGSEFDYNGYTLGSAQTNIKNDIDACILAWQEYYSAKNVYQTGLFEFLELENDLSESWSKYTVVTTIDDESLLRTY